jgi:hypothetical protein
METNSNTAVIYCGVLTLENVEKHALKMYAAV